MIVVHIESGLGNQMLDYVDYLEFKRNNPQSEIYIENLIYEIDQNGISMWNGYELDKVFNINESNIKELFNAQQWDSIIHDVCSSKFWLNSKGIWDYSNVYIQAFSKQGLELEDHCLSIVYQYQYDTNFKKIKKRAKKHFGYFYYVLKKYKNKFIINHLDNSKYNKKTGNNVLCGHTLSFMQKNNGINLTREEIVSAFTFPKILDNKNLEYYDLIKKTNSVSIHVRRGDMLEGNTDIYMYGYFKKAVRYIKSKVNNPTFFFFCDSDSETWCKENLKKFNLDMICDDLYFVNWNTGKESYIDMQLMSICKHNIISVGSFGWWGSYLNENKNKITISPDSRINTKINL